MDDPIALVIDNDQGLLNEAVGLAKQHQKPEELGYHLMWWVFRHGPLRREFWSNDCYVAHHRNKKDYFLWLANHYIQKVQEGV